MKYPLLYLFSLLFILSCDPPMDDKQVSPLKQTHTYVEDSAAENANNSDSALPENLDEDNLYNLYRDIWQNPLGVIEQMGNLEGKTIADIGAGPYGYFSIQLAARTKANKIISIDIDPVAIKQIDGAKTLLTPEVAQKIETRLVTPNDPKLKDGEVDIVLIVNTAIYFEDRVDYFKNLRKGLAKDGRLIIIDFKMRKSPVGPPLENRIPLGKIESELSQAGYEVVESDDRTLDYQYIVFAGNK